MSLIFLISIDELWVSEPVLTEIWEEPHSSPSPCVGETQKWWDSRLSDLVVSDVGVIVAR